MEASNRLDIDRFNVFLDNSYQEEKVGVVVFEQEVVVQIIMESRPVKLFGLHELEMVPVAIRRDMKEDIEPKKENIVNKIKKNTHHKPEKKKVSFKEDQENKENIDEEDPFDLEKILPAPRCKKAFTEAQIKLDKKEAGKQVETKEKLEVVIDELKAMYMDKKEIDKNVQTKEKQDHVIDELEAMFHNTNLDKNYTREKFKAKKTKITKKDTKASLDDQIQAEIIQIETKLGEASRVKLDKEIEELEAKFGQTTLKIREPKTPNSSVKKHIQETIKQLEKKLECPLCLKEAFPPILVCLLGHLVCSR